MRRLALSIVGIMSIAACASSPSRGPARDRDRISPEEIATIQVGSAYEIVQALRPEYLRTRGATSLRGGSAEYAVVYVDGVRAGGLDELRRVPREVVQEIRYLNSNDATTMYGTNHGGGAIMVITKRGR